MRIRFSDGERASFSCTCLDHVRSADEHNTACKHFLAVSFRDHDASAPFLPVIEKKVLEPIFQRLLANLRSARTDDQRIKASENIDLCARRSAASYRAAKSTGALRELQAPPPPPPPSSAAPRAAAATANAITGLIAGTAPRAIGAPLPHVAIQGSVEGARKRRRLFGGEVVHVWPTGFKPGRVEMLRGWLLDYGATLYESCSGSGGGGCSSGDGGDYCDALVVADDAAGATAAVDQWWWEEAGGTAVVLRVEWVMDSIKDGRKRNGSEYKLARQPSPPPSAAAAAAVAPPAAEPVDRSRSPSPSSPPPSPQTVPRQRISAAAAAAGLASHD